MNISKISTPITDISNINGKSNTIMIPARTNRPALVISGMDIVTRVEKNEAYKLFSQDLKNETSVFKKVGKFLKYSFSEKEQMKYITKAREDRANKMAQFIEHLKKNNQITKTGQIIKK